MSKSICSIVGATGLAALLGACSAAIDAPQRPGPDAARAQVPPSEAERRAARLLSLSNNSSLDSKSDPYDRAIACMVAIDLLTARLTEAIGVTGDQRRALAMARQIYERRAIAAAGKASRGIAVDVEKVRSQVEDPNQQARTGVSCLRQLA